MQLAGTRGADRRAGRVDAPCLADPRRRRSVPRVDLALQARAPGGLPEVVLVALGQPRWAVRCGAAPAGSCAGPA